MKIIEALKLIKDLQRKADDIRKLAAEHSAISSMDTPKYKKQDEQVMRWVQSYTDILKEILRLRIAIQRTNLAVPVTINIDGKEVTKSIAEWVIRRRELAKLEQAVWDSLTDRNIKEGMVKSPSGEMFEVKIVRYYSPEIRDRMRLTLASEPRTIDSQLEIINATTDLV